MTRTRPLTAEVIRRHWDRRALLFDDQTGHGLVNETQRLAWLDLLSRLTGPEPVKVLDLGCGTGFLALALAELGHAVTGVDLSPKMIDQARRKAARADQRIDFRVGDAVHLECADETYDLVVARHVIWNLPDPKRGVREWLRVLRPEGRLALIEGQWADNEALELALRRPASRVLARAVDVAAALVLRGGGIPTKLLDFKYRRLEAQLPFSGGPPADRLVAFLTANSLDDVSTEPLMDPTLWGEKPAFPRYLAMGKRPSDFSSRR